MNTTFWAGSGVLVRPPITWNPENLLQNFHRISQIYSPLKTWRLRSENWWLETVTFPLFKMVLFLFQKTLVPFLFFFWGGCIPLSNFAIPKSQAPPNITPKSMLSSGDLQETSRISWKNRVKLVKVVHVEGPAGLWSWDVSWPRDWSRLAWPFLVGDFNPSEKK